MKKVLSTVLVVLMFGVVSAASAQSDSLRIPLILGQEKGDVLIVTETEAIEAYGALVDKQHRTVSEEKLFQALVFSLGTRRTASVNGCDARLLSISERALLGTGSRLMGNICLERTAKLNGKN
jgi:hypothetical protein